MSNPQTHTVLEGFFKKQWGQVVASLVREFGAAHWQDAENACQSALLKALDHWSVDGAPSNAQAWVYRVARNSLLDELRRHATSSRYAQEVTHALYDQSQACPSVAYSEPLEDDVLKMMFTCCHPSIKPRDSVILMLRTLSGFSYEEIGQALLMSYEASKKAMTRCRQTIIESGLTFELPANEALEPRLGAVLKVIYLLFNEGYMASQGDELIRRELCQEADRLLDLLRSSSLAGDTRIWALSALVNLQSSRVAARIGSDGQPVRLADQDRRLWNPTLINSGFSYLDRSAQGLQISPYHLEAAIAACHIRATTYGQTDWPLIIQYYDHLLALNDSPVVRLNRAAAWMEAYGAQAALPLLQELQQDKTLKDSYWLAAVLAACFERLGEQESASHWYEQAAERSSNTVLHRHWMALVD